MMDGFITALQFLTRIRIFKQEQWAPAAFSQSVPWFPLVGALVGLWLAACSFLLLPCDQLLRAVLLLCAELAVTGVTLADGLMDTADGVFSGRGRERMLEIMKDSHVGANGVIAFVLVAFLKVALYNALPGELLPGLLFALPVVTRLLLVVAITHFKYARPEGIGKLFTQHAVKSYAYRAGLLACLLILPTFSWLVGGAALSCLLLGLLTACYLSRTLGGLTGDTYGFIAETGSVFFLLSAYGLWRLVLK